LHYNLAIFLKQLVACHCGGSKQFRNLVMTNQYFYSALGLQQKRQARGRLPNDQRAASLNIPISKWFTLKGRLWRK